jgi:ferredoxin-NADP reductase
LTCSARSPKRWATPPPAPLLAAWDEAYTALDTLCIDAEMMNYAQAGIERSKGCRAEPAGGDVFHATTDAGSAAREVCMDVAALPSWPRSEANVYLCGPLPFMQAQRLGPAGAGVPVTRLQRGVFGPELDDLL